MGRVGKKTASREVGIFFFFPNFNFFKLECTGGKVKKKKKIEKKKKSPSRPFLAHPAGGQETIFYLRMAWGPGLSHSQGPETRWVRGAGGKKVFNIG